MAVSVSKKTDIINVKDAPFNARGDGVTDDTGAIAAALTAANVAGSTSWYSTNGTTVVYLPPGVYPISDLLTVPVWVQLRGAGARVSILKAVHADAGVAITGSGGSHGWFGLDGDDIGTDGLYLPISNENRFESIEIRGWTGTGVHCENLQNAILAEVNCHDNGTGVVIDTQTNSCIFLRCEFAHNSQRNVYGPYTIGTVNNVLFDTCILEGTSALAGMEILHGSYIFRNTVFGGAQDSLKSVILGPRAVGSTTCDVVFVDSSRIGTGENHTALELNTSSVMVFADLTGYIGGPASSTAVAITDSTVRLRGFGPQINGPGTAYTYAGSATRVLCQNALIRQALNVDVPTATDRILWSRINGVQTAFVADAAGTLTWGPTTTGVLDTNLYREAANALKTDDKLHIALELEIDGALNHDGTTVGFYGVTPATRPAALTAANAGSINTGDATSDTVIGNMRTRIGELEAKLQALGLLS